MTSTPAASPARPARPEIELVVVATQRLSPSMVRLRLRSDDLTAFDGSVFTDRYVKLQLPQPDGSRVVRTYTALEPDVAAGTLAIDFVVHGTEGYAGPWAAAAQPGDKVAARGPGGAFRPDADADWHLFAGDESALPAIRAALAALPDDARGHALIEAPAGHEQELLAPAGVEVRWVPEALLAAVREVTWAPGRVQAFVHGEAEVVMHGIRPYLLKERGVPRADVSVSGYWRRGRTEETFREWNRELAQAESGV